MNSQTRGLRVAAIVFGLFALAQLCRLILQPEIIVAGHLIPLWPSAIAVVVLLTLCLWLWSLARRPARA